MDIKFSKRLDEIKEYYFSGKLDEVRRLEAGGMKVINLGIGSPDMAPSDETVDELIKSAKNPKNHSYQPYRSIKPLRTAISEFYTAIYHIKADADKEILPLIGSKEGVFTCQWLCLTAGTRYYYQILVILHIQALLRLQEGKQYIKFKRR